jgi:hypothetical protein
MDEREDRWIGVKPSLSDCSLAPQFYYIRHLIKASNPKQDCERRDIEIKNS